MKSRPSKALLSLPSAFLYCFSHTCLEGCCAQAVIYDGLCDIVICTRVWADREFTSCKMVDCVVQQVYHENAVLSSHDKSESFKKYMMLLFCCS